MSYVEKALYRYVKSIFTKGFKVLTDRKYLFFSISFVLISLTSTIFYFVEKNTPPSDIFSNITSIMIKIELAVAITYIIFGILFARYPVRYWGIPALVTAIGGFFILYYIQAISPFVAAICYLSWIIMSTFLLFSLSRNFFGNEVLGSIMFLGKPADEGSILFSGIVFILSLVNGGMSSYLIYDGITSDPIKIGLLISASCVLITVVLVNFVIFKWGNTDDVFYTILAFYYVFSSFTLWKLTFYEYRDNQPSDNILSMLVTLFFIFYAVSSYGRKIDAIEEEANILMSSPEMDLDENLSRRERKKKKRKLEEQIETKQRLEEEMEDKWTLLKIPTKMGPLGVLMTAMGLILGYHVTYLQFLSDTDFFTGTDYFFMANNELVGIKDKFALIFLTFIMIFLLLSYRFSRKFRNYASPELYRYEFLPSFEELMEKLEKIQSGEESWKSYAMQFLKEGVKIGVKSAAKKTIVSPTKKVVSSVKNLFRKEE